MNTRMMWSYLVVFSLMVPGISTVKSQVILAPPAKTGNVLRGFLTYPSEPDVICGGNDFTYCTPLFETAGIIEFDADRTQNGATLPLPSMTENNWRAKLRGLKVINTHTYYYGVGPPSQYYITFGLYDLDDAGEDGLITEDDWYAKGDYIRFLFDAMPPPGIEFNNIDVTDALRKDLFGTGTGDETTGFYLGISWWYWRMGMIARVFYDKDTPYIEILVQPSPTPVPTVTSTPTITPTPTQIPTCTPTATPPDGIKLILNMPESPVHAGDTFYLDVTIINANPDPLTDIPLFVILEAAGTFWYHPSWSMDPAWESLSIIPTGPMGLTILSPFQWPGNAGTGTARFWGALTDQKMMRILGDNDVRDFGWK